MHKLRIKPSMFGTIIRFQVQKSLGSTAHMYFLIVYILPSPSRQLTEHSQVFSHPDPDLFSISTVDGQRDYYGADGGGGVGVQPF